MSSNVTRNFFQQKQNLENKVKDRDTDLRDRMVFHIIMQKSYVDEKSL